MKRLMKKALLPVGALVLIISVAYTPDYFEISKQLDIFTTAFKEVNLYYVDDTEPGELMEEAITGMLTSLDPYTNYIPEERVEDFKIQTTGNYGGIGASIRRYKDKVYITAPYEGFAADKAGLKAGDVLLSVDGESVEGKSTEDISQVLKGAAGTEVELTIERNGVKETKKIERDEVQVPSVPYYGMLNDGIGYIHLSSFTEKASREIKAALKTLKDENELKGLVLDLRGNPGGLLSEAVNVTNIFIDKNKEVVKTKGKLEEWEKSYKTLSKPDDTELPLVVLINRGSASASEIVAGTLQDYDRAVVVGQRSFGKGLVQQTRKLSYGSQIKVTIAKYYTPSGRCIQAINYAQRAEDGSVEKIPDSLRTAFTTQGGRTVYDGGGIDPDITLETTPLSDIAVTLYAQMHLFNYATDFVQEHESIAAPKQFTISEEEYANFRHYLSDKEFDYKTETERELEAFIEAAKEEEYYTLLKSSVDKLESEYHEREKDDLKNFSADIKELLSEEIAARYYYEEGRIANALQYDKEVEKAVEVLNNQTEYTGVLTAVK